MFIEPGRQFSQAPKERPVRDVAPSELGELLWNAFYKHSAPLALGDPRGCQQYHNSRHTILNKALANEIRQVVIH
jgi:hypothetical protein